MTATQPNSGSYTRRGMMRATAVGVGAAAGIGAIGTTARPAAAIDWGSVGKTVALAAVSPPAALGWALREYEVVGSDSPAEGLTADVLKQEVYETARTRKSTNASTIVDNQNILDGVENTAYTDAKIAAIEELNAGSSESAVLDAANTAIDSYFTTIQKNYLKTWNEAVNEQMNLVSAVESHSNLSLGDLYSAYNEGYDDPPNSITSTTETFTLPDGTDFTVQRLGVSETNSVDANVGTSWSPLSGGTGGLNNDYRVQPHIRITYSDGVTYLDYSDWGTLHSDAETVKQNVRDGISTWVTNVYGEVQSGAIEISELITPQERAAMLSDDETEAQAIADLAALNIPIDPEREATITISETSATLSGTIGLTDESDGPIESGSTYQPSTFSGDVYFTTDVSQITGTWDAYETGVDGGTITLTAKPYEGTVLDVTTTDGETVSVPASDWTDNGDGTYSYDASAGLETNITEVESVSYASVSDETQYETLNLSKGFTVESIVNRETGEQTSKASFESNEPQTDSNYITQDEWDQLEQQNQELIEKYEESQSSGGAGAGFFDGQSPDIGVIAAVLGVAGVAYAVMTEGQS